ncbi:hypothetical protein ElyMa_001212600 [Elysia marginata]|uniref:Reverse transcriptase domain-containing protein n=1 Tax=Elysia marginata TaxID=1093978 RepID=A0AAV4IBB6_9GAST|nr:hypothetical protein ElyMa_001212600 [Elysia marginata]
MPFMSNVGTPQGDSLSPVLFTIYLENALREIRTTIPEPNSSFGREIPSEIAYADDVDFIGHDYANIAKIQETLEKHQLKVNTDKTEFTLLSKSEENWKKGKKVGSLIDDNEDIERRKQLSSTALSRLNNLWLKDNKIKTATKIHLYKSLKLFGHILRRRRDIPANKATRAYFIQCGKNHRGRPRKTLPTVLNRDLALIDHEIRLHSSDELDKINALAQDRRQWHEMTVKIERAAEASQTENWDEPRH